MPTSDELSPGILVMPTGAETNMLVHRGFKYTLNDIIFEFCLNIHRYFVIDLRGTRLRALEPTSSPLSVHSRRGKFGADTLLFLMAHSLFQTICC